MADSVDKDRLDCELPGIGQLGALYKIDHSLPLSCIVGKKVQKVGRTTGLTSGKVIAYAVEHEDSPDTNIYSDFLIVGDDNQFDGEGDSGSVIVMPVSVG